MSSLLSINSLSGSRQSTSIRAPQWYSPDCRDDLYWYANLCFCSIAREICCSLLSQQIYQENTTWWRNISRRNIYASAKYRNEIDNNSSTHSPLVGRYELWRFSYFFQPIPLLMTKGPAPKTNVGGDIHHGIEIIADSCIQNLLYAMQLQLLDLDLLSSSLRLFWDISEM